MECCFRVHAKDDEKHFGDTGDNEPTARGGQARLSVSRCRTLVDLLIVCPSYPSLPRIFLAGSAAGSSHRGTLASDPALDRRCSFSGGNEAIVTSMRSPRRPSYLAGERHETGVRVRDLLNDLRPDRGTYRLGGVLPPLGAPSAVRTARPFYLQKMLLLPTRLSREPCCHVPDSAVSSVGFSWGSLP
jgi:hypothetical protein